MLAITSVPAQCSLAPNDNAKEKGSKAQPKQNSLTQWAQPHEAPKPTGGYIANTCKHKKRPAAQERKNHPNSKLQNAVDSVRTSFGRAAAQLSLSPPNAASANGTRRGMPLRSAPLEVQTK